MNIFNFKFALFLAAGAIFSFQNAFGLVYSSSQINAKTEDFPEFVFTQAILTDQNQQPVCAVHLAGRPDLAPSIARVANEDAQLSNLFHLPSCEEDQLEVIRLTSQGAAENVKTAALPAVALAGLAICELTGLAGTALGTATALGLYEASGDVPGTIVGSIEGFVRLAGKPRLLRYTFGGPIGFVCGSVSDAAAYTGVTFILEQIEKSKN